MRSVLLSLLVVLAVSATAPPASSAGREPRALVLLHRWDARRAAAYATSDPAALRALYPQGSTAAAADVRLLRDYAARGLRVRGLGTQVGSVRVLARGPRRVELVVVERVYGAVVGHDRCRRLPGDGWHVRDITLIRREDRWLVSRVAAG